MCQIRAIIGASLDLVLEGVEVVPRILVPMICTAHELEAITTLIGQVANEVRAMLVKAVTLRGDELVHTHFFCHDPALVIHLSVMC